MITFIRQSPDINLLREEFNWPDSPLDESIIGLSYYVVRINGKYEDARIKVDFNPVTFRVQDCNVVDYNYYMQTTG